MNLCFKHRSILCLLGISILIVTCSGNSQANATCFAQGDQQEEKTYEQRTWVDDTGKYTLQAEFVEVILKSDEQVAVLKAPTGSVMEIPLAKLSDADQSYVAELLSPKPTEPAIETPPSQPSGVQPPAMDNVPLDNGAGGNNGGGVNNGVGGAALANPPGQPRDNSSGAMPLPGVEKRGQSVALPTERTRPAANQVVGDAIQLNDLERNSEGLAKKNPEYFVSVDPNQFNVLGPELKSIVQTLHQSDSLLEKEGALKALIARWPNNREPSLISVVINCASAKEKSIRLTSIELLATHDPGPSLKYILARVDDTSFDVRWRTYELLSAMGDSRMIPELAKRFPGRDRRKIANVMKAVGSNAEPEILAFLDYPDKETVLDACNLLGSIGTQKSLAKLDEVAGNAKTIMLKIQARTSAEKIRARLDADAARDAQGVR